MYLAHRGNPPAAILDDEADSSARAWAAARPVPTLIVGPKRGLACRHVRTLESWADGLGMGDRQGHVAGPNAAG
ncbi:MAG: hypothetical protein ACYDHB_13805, partial [Candidatus Dormibacteria bacterium]